MFVYFQLARSADNPGVCFLNRTLENIDECNENEIKRKR